MKIFTLCKPYLLSRKFSLLAYILIILLSTAISILSPYIIGDFLDNLIEGADIGVILRFCLIFGGLSVLRIAKGYITAIMHVKLQINMAYDFNRDVLQHVQSLSLSYINHQDSAALSQKIGTDANSLITFCINLLQSFLVNITMLIVPFIILLTMNRLTAMFMVGFIAVYFALYFAFKKPLYNASLAFREAQAKFFSKLLEQLKYIRLIKINSIQQEINQRADTSFIRQLDTAVASQKINYLYSSLDGIISTVAQIALFVVGGIQILYGNFTIGMFTIFTSYFHMMLSSSRYFFGLGAFYQNTLVSYDRIKEILNQHPESQGTMVIGGIEKINLKDVSFSYKGLAGESKVLNRFNAEFVKGNIYAVTGANGAGKSTLISLIQGLYIDEYEGCITYNGTDIRHINMMAARKNLIGFAEQEPSLIGDSIRYNLSYSGTKLNDYAEILNMQDFIAKHTLEFEINETNSNISGGEKQKVSILKVLCKNPPVMIFDEPTSALDAQTTEKFINYLQQIKGDKIIIIITHEDVVNGFYDNITRI